MLAIDCGGEVHLTSHPTLPHLTLRCVFSRVKMSLCPQVLPVSPPTPTPPLPPTPPDAVPCVQSSEDVPLSSGTTSLPHSHPSTPRPTCRWVVSSEDVPLSSDATSLLRSDPTLCAAVASSAVDTAPSMWRVS